MLLILILVRSVEWKIFSVYESAFPIKISFSLLLLLNKFLYNHLSLVQNAASWIVKNILQ